MGETKNTKRYTTFVDGKPVTTIPDVVNNKEIYEIKDTKYVSNSLQIKAERKVAKDNGYSNR